MRAKILVSYREDDDPGFARALFQQLDRHLPDAELFMDVHTSVRGAKATAVIEKTVRRSDIVLAVIGPRWQRGASDDDSVALEIRTALELKRRLVPVLVGGAGMPVPGELDPSLKELARRSAVELRPAHFAADCRALVDQLETGARSPWGRRWVAGGLAAVALLVGAAFALGWG